MVDRNGSGHDERNSVDPGQHDDHAHVGDSCDATAASSAETGTEHIGATEVPRSEENAAEAGTVLNFPARTDQGTDDLDEEIDETQLKPTDLAEVQADDALLDALGGADPDIRAYAGSDPGVEALLVSWRRDVDAAPIAELVDVDTAANAIAEGRRTPRRRKRWHLVPVACAAAVLMITSTGVGLAAREALPGDMLWGVARMLYTDHARAVEAADSADSELKKAWLAWQRGDASAAQEALLRAQQQMRDVDDEHGRSSLEEKHQQLSERLNSGQDTDESSATGSTSATLSSGSRPPLPPPTERPLPPPPPPPTTTTPTPPTSTPDPTEPTEPTTPPPSSDTDSSGAPPTENPWDTGPHHSGPVPSSP